MGMTKEEYKYQGMVDAPKSSGDTTQSVFDREFACIMGYESIKIELRRIVDIMLNPQKYKDLGVSTPRGILINGVPGLGKSLIANCFIKASGRRAFICRKDKPNGSFVEEIHRIYEEAKENAPSIVFLDDMDKFANEDDHHPNAEEYVTVQSCIDGCKDFEVLTIATTNDLNCLPESLLRVGRFDKNFRINPPEGEEAEKIIEYYLSQKKNVGDIDIKQIVKILNGRSCAEFETVINEAGIYAGFENRDKIDMNDIIRATMRVLFDAPELLSNEIKTHLEEVAYHEAGHSVVAEILEPGSVNIVSIKRYSGDTGGVTSFYQKQDYFYSKKRMENRVICMLAGKAATELMFGVIDVGAKNDTERAIKIIERFVGDFCAYGFNNFEYRYSLSNEFYTKREGLIFNECERYYQMAKKILVDNREFLDKLAKALVGNETLISQDVQKIKESCKIVNFNF